MSVRKSDTADLVCPDHGGYTDDRESPRGCPGCATCDHCGYPLNANGFCTAPLSSAD